jgi:serine/threonine protein kinase
VFLAQEKAIGFVCVIKKMSKRRIKETKVEEHVLREIKIQSYLNHGSLTALYGCFQDEENLYLVLEALPEGSLQQVKKKRKLPEREAAGIVRQVSEGLKYMHEEYVIHRDLKPENLFVNDVRIRLFRV